MLALFLFGEFLLHIRCFLYFSLRSFSYTVFLKIFIWGVPLYIPSLLYFSVGSFSYTFTPHTFYGICWLKKKFKKSGEFLFHTPYLFLFIWGISLTHPVLAFFGGSNLTSFFSGEFLLHIPCWLLFYLGSFSYTSHACFIFFCGGFLLHMLASIFFFSFSSGEFLLHIPCWLLFSFFLSGEFLLHIPCLLYFSVGSFSYTSMLAFSFFFFFISGVSLTHPMLALFFI